MTEYANQHQRGKGRRLFTVALTALIAIIAVKWAWNGAGADIFALPSASFAQIGAIIIALIAAIMLVKILFGAARSRNGS